MIITCFPSKFPENPSNWEAALHLQEITGPIDPFNLVQDRLAHTKRMSIKGCRRPPPPVAETMADLTANAISAYFIV
jgi:hypothetical protein